MGDQKSNAMGSLIWRRALLSMSAVALTLLVIEPLRGSLLPGARPGLPARLHAAARCDPWLTSDSADGAVAAGAGGSCPGARRGGAPGGFRGDLDLDRDRESTARLLVLGDSFVMAENVPLEGTFVRQLAFELERGLGCEVEGVNAGRSGYGPDQSLLLLEREIDTVAPDVIVCVLCAHNDVGDLARNKAPSPWTGRRTCPLSAADRRAVGGRVRPPRGALWRPRDPAARSLLAGGP